ncbi:unnamed protein product [Nezara viridula]|uniref:Uncharacterized protein n=1 Tax=Nezara viridula TaxID=85310 RepID=A0A9P0HCQ5_NEZVI|nr:unnamed protein product [Nezara viridula]
MGIKDRIGSPLGSDVPIRDNPLRRRSTIDEFLEQLGDGGGVILTWPLFEKSDNGDKWEDRSVKMKLKLNNDKLDKTEQTCQAKPNIDPEPVKIVIDEAIPPSIDETLPALCCEMGCQLVKISLLAGVVSALCFLFGVLFYNVVLVQYGL